MLRAARFDATLYEELRRDPVAYAQAITILFMALGALVAGATIFLMWHKGPLEALPFLLLDPFGRWALPCMSLFLLGGLARVHDPDRGSDRDLMIAIGFAASPGVLWMIPSDLAGIVVWGWVMSGLIVASKNVLGIPLTRAIFFILPGLLLYFVMIALVELFAGRAAA